jgi:hypothetical protein
MTVNEPEGVTDGQEEVGSPDENQGGSELNPAWNEVLGLIPEDLRPQVTPHLQQWDQNYDKVQSTYAPYKPFVDNQIPAENLQFAMGVMQQIEQDPLSVIESLKQYAQQSGLLKDEEQPSTGTPNDQGQVDEDELSQNPRFQQMQQELQEMRTFVESFGQKYLSEQQQAEQQAEDEELSQQLDALKEEHGDFDVDWVLNRALQAVNAGGNADDLTPFVEQYKQYEQGIVSKYQKPAPKLLPSGGTAPDSQIDMRTLTPEQRTKLITERIMAANQSQ